MPETESSQLNVDHLYSMLIKFYNEYGDELEACHPEAIDFILDIVNSSLESYDNLKDLTMDFFLDYFEELEGCNEEASELMSDIITKYNIK